MILILHILEFESRNHTKFQISLSISLRENNALFNFNMQISKCSIHIKFWSKTLKNFLYKFQNMYNNFKYEFHDK